MSEETRHPFEARLAAWPDPRLERVLRARVEHQLDYLPAQVEMDQAHTVMLAEQGVLSADEAAQILGVLDELSRHGAEVLRLETARSSLFWYVEALLIERLGEHVGGKMHTGRSHNDIMPTVSRMTARRRLLDMIAAIIDLQQAILERARETVSAVMPGYTALQHGQPWTLGHYLVGWVYAFERDFRRVRQAYGTTNLSPLGAAALAGTSWPLDRRRTAHLLGFDDLLINSRDAGFGTRDYVAEIVAATGIAMTNLSSLCSDLYLWSSYEFGFIEMADGFSGTSSLMPQKKNAWAVDWTRGAAGNVIASYASSLAPMRGASSTDGALQDYPERPLRETLETGTDYFTLIAGTIETLTVREERMAELARANWTTASNLADVIAREADLSFRAAHGVVARAVRRAIDAGVAPDQLSAEAVDDAAEEVLGRRLGLADGLIRDALDPTRFLATRVTIGSVNPDEVRSMLGDARGRWEAERRWLDEQVARLSAAREELVAAVRTLLGQA